LDASVEAPKVDTTAPPKVKVEAAKVDAVILPPKIVEARMVDATSGPEKMEEPTACIVDTLRVEPTPTEKLSVEASTVEIISNGVVIEIAAWSVDTINISALVVPATVFVPIVSTLNPPDPT